MPHGQEETQDTHNLQNTQNPAPTNCAKDTKHEIVRQRNKRVAAFFKETFISSDEKKYYLPIRFSLADSINDSLNALVDQIVEMNERIKNQSDEKIHPAHQHDITELHIYTDSMPKFSYKLYHALSVFFSPEILAYNKIVKEPYQELGCKLVALHRLCFDCWLQSDNHALRNDLRKAAYKLNIISQFILDELLSLFGADNQTETDTLDNLIIDLNNFLHTQIPNELKQTINNIELDNPIKEIKKIYHNNCTSLAYQAYCVTFNILDKNYNKRSIREAILGFPPVTATLAWKMSGYICAVLALPLLLIKIPAKTLEFSFKLVELNLRKHDNFLAKGFEHSAGILSSLIRYATCLDPIQAIKECMAEDARPVKWFGACVGKIIGIGIGAILSLGGILCATVFAPQAVLSIISGIAGKSAAIATAHTINTAATQLPCASLNNTINAPARWAGVSSTAQNLSALSIAKPAINHSIVKHFAIKNQEPKRHEELITDNSTSSTHRANESINVNLSPTAPHH